jgi:hypothetical protein
MAEKKRESAAFTKILARKYLVRIFLSNNRIGILERIDHIIAVIGVDDCYNRLNGISVLLFSEPDSINRDLIRQRGMICIENSLSWQSS